MTITLPIFYWAISFDCVATPIPRLSFFLFVLQRDTFHDPDNVIAPILGQRA
ncbi:MAG: hypothetical protein NNA18_02540 [Nitrospira sp.]|nr:hypothetical protein [Nitrospira sp.]